MGEEQRAQASIKRKRQHKIVDKGASYIIYGPPDKSEHFLSDDDDNFNNVPKPKKGKVATKKSSVKIEGIIFGWRLVQRVAWRP